MERIPPEMLEPVVFNAFGRQVEGARGRAVVEAMKHQREVERAREFREKEALRYELEAERAAAPTEESVPREVAREPVGMEIADGKARAQDVSTPAAAQSPAPASQASRPRSEGGRPDSVSVFVERKEWEYARPKTEGGIRMRGVVPGREARPFTPKVFSHSIDAPVSAATCHCGSAAAGVRVATPIHAAAATTALTISVFISIS